MKIEGMTPKVAQTKPQPQKKAKAVKSQEKILQQQQQEKAARLVKANQAQKKPIKLTKTASKEIMKNYAEYYFKQGKQLENVKSYKQAISAYERSNVVAPDYNKAKSVNNVRNKEFKK